MRYFATFTGWKLPGRASVAGPFTIEVYEDKTQSKTLCWKARLKPTNQPLSVATSRRAVDAKNIVNAQFEKRAVDWAETP